MAVIRRKEPAAPPTRERAKPTAPDKGAGKDTGRFAKLSGNVRDILSELRKVTWPTREETRNLTIVVVGISATIGVLLGALDAILSYLYRLVNPL
ncbi:MAG TPA: preprotein translocase subunit SecE [Chloroflexia bacterium]|nr:preprotein translocase subunit SecE [Chloroflexia bacterium]